ncbi:MAG: hypothetical protein IPH44_21620 [Myxococcales bacterium]|nr:hypothetical protein [Myxococcales bacterium]MBK7191958.1 hypothetical protein [Myxococcales bacterium]MBP6842205.1 hypothetical protein [Kofleriaceae bacterium]
MRWSLGTGVLAVVLVGCGGDDGDSTYTIAFEGDLEAVGLVAAQDGGGPWEAVALDGSGHGTFTVTRGYHALAFVCPTPTFVFVHELHDAGDDGTVRQLCRSTSAPLHVQGAVTPPDAAVWIAGGRVGHVPGSYQTNVRAGTYDVMASTATRMRIDRAVVVAADTTHDLDLTTGGFDLATTSLTVTGAAAPTTYCELHTANAGYAQLLGTTTAVPLVPGAQRLADDRVVVGAVATDGDVTRFVQRRVTGETAPALAFVDGAPVTADRAGVHWSTGWADYGVGMIVAGPTNLYIGIAASQGWADATGTTTLSWPDLAALPGWDPSWPTPAVGASLRASSYGSTGTQDGDLDQRVVGAPLIW